MGYVSWAKVKMASDSYRIFNLLKYTMEIILGRKVQGEKICRDDNGKDHKRQTRSN